MCMYSVYAAASVDNFAADAADVCEEAFQINDGPLALSFIAQCRIDLPKQGYTLVADAGEHMTALSRVLRALKRLDSFDFPILQNSKELMFSTLFGENVLKKRTVWHFWQQILKWP